MSDNKQTYAIQVELRVYAVSLAAASTIVETRLRGEYASPSRDPDCVQVDVIKTKLQPRGK